MKSALKTATLYAFALSLLANLMLAHGAVDWRAIPAALIGWYLADASSGLIHMYMDYRPSRRGMGLKEVFFYPGSRESAEYLAFKASVMRRVGMLERVIFDFKTHHPRPDALGRRSFVALIWSTVAFGALPASLALNVAALLVPVPAWLMAGLVTLLIGSGFAQYFHAALHRPDPPWIIRALRSVRLVMTPEAHARHHASLRRDFATNSGWSNPLLNPIFAALHRRGLLRDDGLEPS